MDVFGFCALCAVFCAVWFAVRGGLSPKVVEPLGEHSSPPKPMPKRPKQPSIGVCSGCSIKPNKTALKACGGCGMAHYCSDTCQKAHWKQHKETCKLLVSKLGAKDSDSIQVRQRFSSWYDHIAPLLDMAAISGLKVTSKAPGKCLAADHFLFLKVVERKGIEYPKAARFEIIELVAKPMDELFRSLSPEQAKPDMEKTHRELVAAYPRNPGMAVSKYVVLQQKEVSSGLDNIQQVLLRTSLVPVPAVGKRPSHEYDRRWKKTLRAMLDSRDADRLIGEANGMSSEVHQIQPAKKATGRRSKRTPQARF